MKKNKLRTIGIIFLIVIILAGGISLYYYKTHYVSVTLHPKQQKEISGTLNRPECGWYRLYSYYLHPDTALTANDLYLEEQDDSGYTFRLALVEFNLAEYASGSLDASALENIQTVFRLFSKTKAKLIVRFLYDWDGIALQKEPKDISIIKKHMKQTARVMNAHADTIFTTQGIFVGNWAEMHGSKYLTREAMTELIAYYAQVTDPSIYLCVRTPQQYRTIKKELEEHPKRYADCQPAKSRLLDRLGLYNDGMLGSVSDTGTYAKADNAATDREALAIRKKELSFQNTLCQTVPNGGEVTTVNSFNDGENAIRDLANMHVSYLNQIYDEAVIRKWRQTAYEGKDPLYRNASVYDYITEHLGARYVLLSCDVSYQPFSGDTAYGVLRLANKGFSSLYHSAVLNISLVSEETGTQSVIFSKEIRNDIPARTKEELSFTFSPFDLEPGSYGMYISLSDSVSGEQISFANDSFHDKMNKYFIGKLTIEK